MLSKSFPESGVAPVMVDLVDQVIRLAGRLATARKMTSGIAGMRTTHWLVLTAICRASSPPTVARIARSFGHNRQGVQRIANALEARGMIAFADDAGDRRAKLLIPTEVGRAAFAIADREGWEWADRLAAGLSPDVIADTVSLLAELRLRLEREARER